MRVVVWLSQTVGKGFSMKSVVLAGAAAGALISGISYKAGQWWERRKNKKDEKEEDKNGEDRPSGN